MKKKKIRKAKKSRMNKKGNFFDLPFIMVLLLIIAVVTLITFFIFDKVQTSLGTNTAFNDTKRYGTNTSISVLESSRTAFLSFDNLFFYAFIAMIMFTLISALFIQSHPVFFIIGILMLILTASIAAVLSNVYNTIENSQSDITTTSALFPKMSYIMNHLPPFIIVFGFLVLIMLVMKPTSLGSV